MKKIVLYLALFAMAAATSAFAVDPAKETQTLVPADQLAAQVEMMIQQQHDNLGVDLGAELDGGWGGHGGGVPRPYPHPYPHPYPAPYPYPYYNPYPTPYYPTPYYPYPTYQRIVCYAQNNLGNSFSAYGVTATDTQELALSYCWQSGAQNCVATGCGFY